MFNKHHGKSMRVPEIRFNNYPKLNSFSNYRNLNSYSRSAGLKGKHYTIEINPKIKDYSYKLMMVIMLAGMLIIMLPSLMGCRFETIRSGSMSPAIGTGSLVITRMVNPYSIDIGEVIAFHPPTNPDTLVVHRVVGIDNGSPLSFITKGDANNSVDGYLLPAEDVVGQVGYSIPRIGYFVSFMQSTLGLMLLVVIPGAIILFLELKKLWSLINTEMQHSKNVARI